MQVVAFVVRVVVAGSSVRATVFFASAGSLVRLARGSSGATGTSLFENLHIPAERRNRIPKTGK